MLRDGLKPCLLHAGRMAHHARHIATLAMALMLPGCTLFGGDADESEAGAFAGPGFAIQIRNDAPTPYTADLVVTDPFGSELDRTTLLVGPNGTEERWNVLVEEPGPHRIELSFNWTARGSAASGSDARTLDTLECEGVIQLGWRFPESGARASEYLGDECVQDQA